LNLLRTRTEGPAEQPAFFVDRFSKRWRSSRIHKTNPMEPGLSRNIAHLISLSARAMQTT
jgi:hypothetical protein